MYKIAVLGDRDSIYGFATLGLETFPVENDEQGAETLKKLAYQDYAIIYVTEGLYGRLSDEVEKFISQKLPAIVPIPGSKGNTGEGMENVQKLVLQAVGTDIFGQD